MRSPRCGGGLRKRRQRQARTVRSAVTTWSNAVAMRARTTDLPLKRRLARNGARLSVAARRPLTVKVTDETFDPETADATAPQRPRRAAVNATAGRARQLAPAQVTRLC